MSDDTRGEPDTTRVESGVSRRQFIKGITCASLALGGMGSLVSACAPAEVGEMPTKTRAPSYSLPTEEGLWKPSAPHTGRIPSESGSVQIQSIGDLAFDPNQIKTVRPDIFQPGHFSLFDILVHLAERGDIALEYHFSEDMDTHVIDAIDGQAEWWYQAYYAHGWFESNVFRMDQYPYKDGTTLRIHGERKDRIANIYRTFQDEVMLLTRNGGQVIIPELRIRAPAAGFLTLQDVIVTPHDVRSDVLQPGVVTALDALISLAEQGRFSALKLTWYEQIGPANPVDNYWVERIDGDIAVGGCGFVYETGPWDYMGFSGTHIHIPADVRVTVSPEYVLWFWICLGRGV